MNPAKKIKELIVKTLAQSGIYVKKIILFGSRARGNFHKYSDYDILIITERTFTVKEKMELSERIRDNLVRLNFPTDIIIKSEQEIAYYQDKIGSVVREALKEGVSV
ncbi:MAG: nucleotidyltransferase domain-containing protein [Euryarchaeota archaeon]|nr:nucleotidyltransferase domain-containing protein [Euryarchaeota archaeon]